MANLKTDYKDQILNTAQNTRRKYRMINNPDGTVSFEDVTDYTQDGDSFGANDINRTNEAINEVANEVASGVVKPSDIVNNWGNASADKPLASSLGKELKNFLDINVGFPTVKVDSSNSSWSDIINMMASKNQRCVAFLGGWSSSWTRLYKPSDQGLLSGNRFIAEVKYYTDGYAVATWYDLQYNNILTATINSNGVTEFENWSFIWGN